MKKLLIMLAAASSVGLLHADNTGLSYTQTTPSTNYRTDSYGSTYSNVPGTRYGSTYSTMPGNQYGSTYSTTPGYTSSYGQSYGCRSNPSSSPTYGSSYINPSYGTSYSNPSYVNPSYGSSSYLNPSYGTSYQNPAYNPSTTQH